MQMWTYFFLSFFCSSALPVYWPSRLGSRAVTRPAL